ncbi:MAG: toll/interleukin-1 receptor domain-containing protein [Chloroflexota bacterium]
MNKKSVFVSYAHYDCWDFARRLVFSLKMYMNVFWDGQLETGPFDPQLYKQIETNDFFLLIMSPFSLRDGGGCRKELDHALEHKNERILLARLFDKCGQPELESALKETYTYGYFVGSADFDAGFRRLTGMMLEQPVSSWEYLAQEKEDKVILKHLQDGILPSIIAKSVAEWVIVDVMWNYVESFIAANELYHMRILRGYPRTPQGVFRHTTPVIKEFLKLGDYASAQLLEDVQKIAEMFLSELDKLPDEEHEIAGNSASKIITGVSHFLADRGSSTRKLHETMAVSAYSNFNAAEKIRELINQYARRSRYLF